MWRAETLVPYLQKDTNVDNPKFKGSNPVKYYKGIDKEMFLNYLRSVYGDITEVTTQVCDLDLIYVDLWKKHIDPSFSIDVTKCPRTTEDVGDFIHNMSNTNDPYNVVWLYHPPPYDAIKSNAWVEVTHCINPTVAQFEEKGYWCYKATGSGVFMNVGRTRAFDTHLEAVQYFLKKVTCVNVNAVGECEGDFYDMIERAVDKGYDSIQFLKHFDQRCGNTAIEILFLHGSGVNVFDDNLDFRMGWNHSLPLKGDKTTNCLNLVPHNLPRRSILYKDPGQKIIVWTYWEKNESPFVRRCLESIEEACDGMFEHKHVTLDSASQFVDVDVIQAAALKANGEPSFLSDVIRLALLKRYGGLYIDSSTMCFRKFSDWFVEKVKHIKDWRQYFIGVFNPVFQVHRRVTVIENSFMYSPPDHDFISEWLSLMKMPRKQFTHSFPHTLLSNVYHYAYLVSSSILTANPLSTQFNMLIFNDAVLNVLSNQISTGKLSKRSEYYKNTGEHDGPILKFVSGCRRLFD